jgi:hypothetical protein
MLANVTCSTVLHATGLSKHYTNWFPFKSFLRQTLYVSLRFEVFTAVTMKNGVFWDVTHCDSCKKRRFGGT